MMGDNAPCWLVLTAPGFSCKPLNEGGTPRRPPKEALSKPRRREEIKVVTAALIARETASRARKEAEAAARDAVSRSRQEAAARAERAKARASRSLVAGGVRPEPQKNMRARARGLIDTDAARAMVGVSRTGMQKIVARGGLVPVVRGRPDWFDPADVRELVAFRDHAGLVAVSTAAKALGLKKRQMDALLDRCGIMPCQRGQRSFITNETLSSLMAERGRVPKEAQG